MVDFLPPVVAKLVADIGEFTASMGKAKTELTGFAAANERMAAAGKVAMLGLGLGAAAAGAESIKLAADFDQTMELIHTQAGAAQSEVEQLKDGVLALAPATGIGPEKLAEGLYHIESTGFRGKEALDILNASARLAAMGMADLDTVTFAMSGTMSVGMKDIRDAADATNYLNTIVGMGDMKMEKLASAIGTGILPSFKSAGLGMKDFGASIATITDNSVGADEAATRLRMTISMMAAPSGPAIKALKEIGLGQYDLAMDLRKPDGLLVAVEDLKHHLEASGKTAVEQNAIISQAFGGGRTSSAILTLLEESERLKSKYEQLGTAESRAAKADEAWQQQQKQFKQQSKEVIAQLEAWGVKLGNFLIPQIQNAFQWMNKHTEAMKVFGIIIGSIVVVAIGVYIVMMAQAAIATIAATWELILIVAAIAAIAVGIYFLVKHWDTVWNWIKKIAGNVWDWLVSAWRATWNAIMSVVNWIKTNIIDPIVNFFDTYFVKPIKALLDYIAVVWKFWAGFLGVIFADIAAVWDKYWNNITATSKWAWDNVLKPVFNFIYEYGIKPLLLNIHLLHEGWNIAWDGIKAAASWAWEHVIKPVFGWIDKLGIQPVKQAASEFGKFWSGLWDGIGNGLSWVYNHTLKPIFDGIMWAVNKIRDGYNDIKNAPSAAGSGLAHFLGFADGGPVPGPPGAPQLAVVHGGEYVLSRDMLAAAGGRPSVAAISSTSGGGGGGGSPQAIYLTAPIIIGGQTMAVLHQQLIPAAQQYKAKNGVTGLS